MAIPSVTLLAGVSLLLICIYKFVVYPAFLSPLSKIPNAHPTSPFSPAWIIWTRYRCNNNRATHAAHEKYGPIVRLAPNEISINCVDEGIRTVYAGGFEKHDWYPNQFASYGVYNMFSTTLSKPHSVRKRMVSNIYSKSYLQASEHLASSSTKLLSRRFLPILEQAAESKTSVDVHDMNNAFTMDFMSAYQFGLPSSTNFSYHLEERKHLLHIYHCRREFEFYNQEIPNIRKWAKLLRIPLVPSYVDTANDELEAWCLRMCDGADKLITTTELGAEPTVYKQLKTAMVKQNGGSKSALESNPEISSWQRFEIASEMLDQLGAGHETSAIALTYLYWEISRNPDVQSSLRKELLTLSPPIHWPQRETDSSFDLPTAKSIDGLSLLHAVIMETLRLHAPIPGVQPRITPANATLAGYSNLPPNVRVNAQAYSLHRNASVFPEPETWNPSRWLQPADSGPMKEMLRWFWAFGSGGRMCVGSNLAIQEMKLIVAAIYTNYTTTIINDEGIEEIDAYTTRPKSNQLFLRFEHV